MKKYIILAALVLLPLFAGAQNNPARRGNQSLCPDSNHPHAIDLGLPSGTKWACCNVGGSKPEDYGGCYAWGETSTKSTYDWKTYRWCNGDYNKLTKYNGTASYGIVDNKMQLEPDDDVAHANWRGSWRMPTITELEELKGNCSFKWITLYGVNGALFTSHSNGRSIFLPAAGRFKDSSLLCRGKDCGYWSSSLHGAYPFRAHFLYFSLRGVQTGNNCRYEGLCVRPVQIGL